MNTGSTTRLPPSIDTSPTDSFEGRLLSQERKTVEDMEHAAVKNVDKGDDSKVGPSMMPLPEDFTPGEYDGTFSKVQNCC